MLSNAPVLKDTYTYKMYIDKVCRETYWLSIDIDATSIKARGDREERGSGGSDCCSNFAVKCKLTSRYRDIKQTLFHFVRIAHFIAHSINICLPSLLLLLLFMSLMCIKYLFSSFHSIFYGKHAACFMCALAKDLWPFDAKLPATCSSMLTLLPVPLVPHCVYLTWPLLGRSSSVCFAYCLYFSAVLFMQTATCTRLLRCPLSIVRSPLPFAFVDMYIYCISDLFYSYNI